MSNVPQDSTKSTETNLAWVRRMWGRNVLAHEGIMLDRIQRVQRISEVLARNTMTGEMKDTTGLPDGSEGDGMGVEIGDRVTNHYYGQVETPQEPPAAAAKKPMGAISKAALAAAILGPWAGVGVWILSQALSPPPPPVETPVDTDTQYEARFEVE